MPHRTLLGYENKITLHFAIFSLLTCVFPLFFCRISRQDRQFHRSTLLIRPTFLILFQGHHPEINHQDLCNNHPPDTDQKHR
jgi:hypothetical protein